MAAGQHQLTFLGDSDILAICSLGLVAVATAVLWVVRQSPNLGADEDGAPQPWWSRLLWGRTGANRHEGEADVAGADGGLLGARTRVVAGGREAAKAARKEAKKRAKSEFKRSHASSSIQERRTRVQDEKKRKAQETERAVERITRAQERTDRSAADVTRRLENYIVDHKVSSLKDLEDEIGIPSSEVASGIEDLEKRGRFTGIVIDNARGGGRSFVRVTPEDIRAIGAFVNSRGRLTVADFTREANRVLQLSELRNDGGEGELKQEQEEKGEEDTDVDTDRTPRVVAIPACKKETVAKALEIEREEDTERLVSTGEEEVAI